MNRRSQVWLHSMTPKQEVSKFLCNRALVLHDIDWSDEALQAVNAAARFNPINPAIRWGILDKMPSRRAWRPTPITLHTTQLVIQAGSAVVFDMARNQSAQDVRNLTVGFVDDGRARLLPSRDVINISHQPNNGPRGGRTPAGS